MDYQQKKCTLEQIICNKVFQYGIIETSNLQFSRQVVDMCKANRCGRYGKYWTCPPAVDGQKRLKEYRQCYGHILVMTTCHNLQDSFDYEGMINAGKQHNRLMRVLFNDLPFETVLLLAHGCKKCSVCTYPDEPCRFPDQATPSLEACGIDVAELARKCQINYINGTDTVTYFSALLF